MNMKSRKITLDRPQVAAKEIQARKNFNRVMQNYQVMARPFYKSAWFFGTAGVASVGLLIGGTLALQDYNADNQANSLLTNAPPELVVPVNRLIALNTDRNDKTDELVQRTLAVDFKRSEIPNREQNDETITQSSNNQNNQELIVPVVSTVNEPVVNMSNDREVYSSMDIHPRISDKIGGPITRQELLDGKGITTEADVNVIHFELHLVDGLGGKVFEEESNQLNQEMKAAVDRVMVGESIYFENIRGKSRNGDVVRLNPLRYVLMN